MTTLLEIGGAAPDGVDWRELDVLRRNTSASRLRRRGTVLAHDEFDGSLCGYAPHLHNDIVVAPPTLTNRFPFRGSQAMMLSTAEDASMSRAQSFRACSVYKRLGWVPGAGKVLSLSAMLALRGTGDMTAQTWPFDTISLGFDAQNEVGDKRAFGSVMLKPIPGDAQGRVGWYLRGGKTSGAADATYRPDVLIPGTEGLWMGLNENKANYAHVRLTVNRAAVENGAGDYYQEFAIGSKVFDLRGLTPTPWDLLLKNGTWDTFSGGNNIGFTAAAASARRLELMVGMATFTVGDDLIL